MALTAPVGNSDYEIVDAGNHIGRCIRVIDLGTHFIKYKDNEKWVHKIRLIFELPTEKMEDGNPFAVMANLNLSMNKKADLRKILESWRGKSFSDDEAEKFDILKLLNATGLINVVHDEKDEYANIKSITPLPKGTTCPAVINEMYTFELKDFKQEAFNKLPEKTREKIMKSKEWEAINNPTEAAKKCSEVFNDNDLKNDSSEDCPF